MRAWVRAKRSRHGEPSALGKTGMANSAIGPRHVAASALLLSWASSLARLVGSQIRNIGIKVTLQAGAVSTEGLNRVSSERKQDWLQVLLYPCATEAAVMIAAYEVNPYLMTIGIFHGCYSMRRRTRIPGVAISALRTA